MRTTRDVTPPPLGFGVEETKPKLTGVNGVTKE